MDKAFESFTYLGRKFLAFPTQGGIHVIDEHGNNFGSYFDRKSFQKMVDKSGVAMQIVGKAALAVRIV